MYGSSPSNLDGGVLPIFSGIWPYNKRTQKFLIAIKRFFLSANLLFYVQTSQKNFPYLKFVHANASSFCIRLLALVTNILTKIVNESNKTQKRFDVNT